MSNRREKKRRPPVEAIRFAVETTCSQCKKNVCGWLALNDALGVCDSGGFLIAGMSPADLKVVCDECCGKHGLPGHELVNGPEDFPRTAEPSCSAPLEM